MFQVYSRSLVQVSGAGHPFRALSLLPPLVRVVEHEALVSRPPLADLVGLACVAVLQRPKNRTDHLYRWSKKGNQVD